MKLKIGITSMKLTLGFVILLGLSTTILSETDEETATKIKDATQRVLEFSDKATEVGKALAEGLEVAKTITEFLGALGPALGAASAIFSLVTMFLPKPDSEELKAIKGLQKQMNERFDRIEEQLQEMKDLIQELNDKDAVRQIANHVETQRAHLKVLEEFGMDFLITRTNRTKNIFIEKCKAFDSIVMVKWIEEALKLKKGPAVDTMLYGPHIFNVLKYESAKWEAWVDYILDTAVFAGLLHMQCINVTGDISLAELEHEKDKLNKKLTAIAERFKAATRDFHNGFEPFAKKAVENSLFVEKTAKEVLDDLEAKYGWLGFAVILMKRSTSPRRTGWWINGASFFDVKGLTWRGAKSGWDVIVGFTTREKGLQTSPEKFRRLVCAERTETLRRAEAVALDLESTGACDIDIVSKSVIKGPVDWPDYFYKAVLLIRKGAVGFEGAFTKFVACETEETECFWSFWFNGP